MKSKRENYKDKFMDTWLTDAINKLGVTNKDAIDKIKNAFAMRYNKSTIEIENTQSAEVHKVEAERFYLNANKTFIMNESSTLTYKHSRKLAVLTPIIQSAILIRKIKKRLKIKVAEIGNAIELAILSNEEYTLKIIVNGLYGLFLYSKSIFYNPSIGNTTTSAGRAVVAVAMLTVEVIGGSWRNYILDSHTQLISNVKKEAKAMSSKYTLPSVTVEQTLEQVLGVHYDDYYAKSFLRDLISKLSVSERSLLYVKNNIEAFMDVPEVREVIKELYALNNRTEETLNKKDQAIFESVVKQFKTDPEYKKKYMLYYASDDKFKAVANKLKEMSAELLMGFYYYNGDYNEGQRYESHIEVAENITREKVPTVDTDSTVTTVYDEVIMLQDKFKEDIGNDVFVEEVVSSVIATVIYGGAITYSLSRYTTAVGVEDKYSHLVEMEEETTMQDLHLDPSKKQYIFNYFIQDGNFNKTIFDVLKIKGNPVIRSDSNADISDAVIDIYKKKIMRPLKDLDYAEIIGGAKELTKSIAGEMRSEDYVLNKSTVKKANKSNSELAFGDAKNKMRRLWARFETPNIIDFPGSFKEVEVTLTSNYLNLMRKETPIYYDAFVEHTREIKIFMLWRTVINNANKIMDDDKPKVSFNELVSNKKFDSGHVEVIKKAIKKYSKYNPETLEIDKALRMHYELFETASDAFSKFARKVFGLGPKLIDLDVNHDDIIAHIKKIGIPVATNELPPFFKLNNYAILDEEYASTGEFLLGKVTNSSGITSPLNHNDRFIVTSALQTY